MTGGVHGGDTARPLQDHCKTSSVLSEICLSVSVSDITDWKVHIVCSVSVTVGEAVAMTQTEAAGLEREFRRTCTIRTICTGLGTLPHAAPYPMPAEHASRLTVCTCIEVHDKYNCVVELSQSHTQRSILLSTPLQSRHSPRGDMAIALQRTGPRLPSNLTLVRLLPRYGMCTCFPGWAAAMARCRMHS